MRALKAFLILMGFFIAAGFAFIGYEVYNRVTDPERRAESVSPPPPPPGRMAETDLKLPAGARIGTVVSVGSRVVFSVQMPDGAGDRLYVLDPRNGAVTAMVTTSATLERPDAQ